MLDYLLQLDDTIILAINGSVSPAFDHFMLAFSGKLIWLPFYALLIGLLIYRFGIRRGLLIVASIAIAVGLADLICASVIRPLVQRMRPSNPLNPISPMIELVNGYHGGRYGFPSCHAANTFALAISILCYWRKLAVPVIIWAALQCYSRMFLGVHYLGDILAGALLGSAIALAIYHLTRKYLLPSHDS